MQIQKMQDSRIIVSEGKIKKVVSEQSLVKKRNANTKKYKQQDKQQDKIVISKEKKKDKFSVFSEYEKRIKI